MTRRATIHGVVFQIGSAAAFAAALLLFGALGCNSTKPNILRYQEPEETGRERYGVPTVGDYCQVADLGPKYVGGVGIVTGLDGTGGDSPKDENRAALQKYLEQYSSHFHVQGGPPSLSEIMRSGSAALVIVSGEIPPGTRPGERFDVEVSLPHGSKATSLRGGVLARCNLSTYDYAHGPESAPTKGHEIAVAEGSLQLSLGSSEGDDDSTRLTRAHIWEGGRSRIDNTISLVLNADQASSRKSAQMAECINLTFQAGSATDAKLAEAAGKDGVRLRVPPAYRLNIPHYLRVVRLIPMIDPEEQPAGGAPGQPKPYLQRLTEDLLDPTRTVTAALRLEALGTKSVPVLRKGLESNHPLVQFCAAESLTYLAHAEGAQKLAVLVEQQPFLRAYALSALASLDESVTRAKLQDLMEKGAADATRYGAFRALQTLDPTDRLTKGELLNSSFRLHRVAPEAPPLLHLCTARRAEIVQFGPEARFVPPFAYESNGYTVTARAGDTQCHVGYVTRDGRPLKFACDLNVSDVVRLLAKMDAMYPEVVEILLDAANEKKISCPVSLDALPQAPSAEELAASGKTGDTLLDLGGQELGDTPTVFERPTARPAPRDRDTSRRPRRDDAAVPSGGQE
jgi:hypothetical protein